MTTTLICDCNQTMPLDAKALGASLGESLTLHTTLCRRQASAFQKAIKADDDVVVACTQESRLFAELAEQTEGAKAGHVSPIRFVNIREAGGWSKDAAKAMPKLAALLALAKLPDPDPVPTVTYTSSGRVLVVGPHDEAMQAATLLGPDMDITVLATRGATRPHLGPRLHPVLSGDIEELSGWLGAFSLTWVKNNPIDLDLCTRCNACLTGCPEGAIDFSYQIDLTACKSHRSCTAVCEVAGAIDFNRPASSETLAFDSVLDLRSVPAFSQHAKPQGYFHAPGAVPASTLLQLKALVGEFEKPKFFNYKQKICAHTRNTTTGCDACIEVCSALAIGSDKAKQGIKVNPNLCVGCGACTTVCPTGALAFAYPKAQDVGQRIKTALQTFYGSGGQNAVVLLHSAGAGQAHVEAWGRAARLPQRGASVGAIHGPGANVIPLALWHTASVGLDVWLSAFAFGAAKVVVLQTDEDAPQYRSAIAEHMQVAQQITNGLGYAGEHFLALDTCALPTQDAQAMGGVEHNFAINYIALDAHHCWTIDQNHAKIGPTSLSFAKFALSPEKRGSLDLALDHLMAHSPVLRSVPADQAPLRIALPVASPFGAIAVDADKCTLCLSCVSACPASALQDNIEKPQLRFVEKNCVQCGLCETTCPEKAIELVPRLLAHEQRKQSVVLNEAQPYRCIRCQKPFGTLMAIENMIGKLAGHAMFQGAAAERLRMCMDCRVIDLYSANNESNIHDL